MTNTSEDAPKRSESEIYDRQIRLWGADAQAKMSQAKVLYIHMTGATSEILKNLVLAGIRPAICDPRKMEDSQDYLRQTPCFFWAPLPDSNDEPDKKKAKLTNPPNTIAELVKPAIQDLNPLLGECEIVPQDIDHLTADILTDYSVICASHVTPTQLLALSQKLTPAQKLVWIDSFGWHGSCWFDLGAQHSYRPEQGKELLDPQPLQPHISISDMYQIPLHLAVNRFHKKMPPPSLVYHKTILAYVDHKQAWPTPTAMTQDENVKDFVSYIRETWLPQTSPSLLDHDLFSVEALSKLAQQATAELVAVCSVTGGMVGNEIIKAISGKGTPANNTVLFDGQTCKGWYFLLQEKK